MDKLYNKYGIDAYNFNIIPEQNLSITYEDIRTILTPLEAINKSTLGVDLSQNGIISIEDFQKIQNALSVFSKGQRRENNTCSANCIGMCVSTCYDACTGCTSCSGTCAGSCNGCTGGCGGACGGCTGCVGHCDGSCLGGPHWADGEWWP